jgi:DNA-binding GntR family transcriptional regulator
VIAVTVYRRPDPIPLPHARPAHGTSRIARVPSDAGPAPIRTASANLSDKFATDLALGLMSGRYLRDGVLWTEPQLCEAFGISRTALRETIKILSAKGIVETRRKRGTILRNRSEWNLLDPDVIGWLLISEPDATIAELGEALRCVAASANAEHRSAGTSSGQDGAQDDSARIKELGNPFLSAFADIARNALEPLGEAQGRKLRAE